MTENHKNQSNQLVTCQKCRTPVFELAGNKLVVRAKHHGEWHTSKYDLNELKEADSPDGPEHADSQV